MNKVWFYIKSNKTVVVLIIVVIVLLVYIFWPVKINEDRTLNDGVARIIDSVIQVNNFKLIQQQQEMKRSVDSALKVINSKDAKIVERIFYQNNQLRSVDTATDAILQGLFDERYRP